MHAPFHITPQVGPSSHRLTDFPGSDAQQFVARMGEQGEKAAYSGVSEGRHSHCAPLDEVRAYHHDRKEMDLAMKGEQQ